MQVNKGQIQSQQNLKANISLEAMFERLLFSVYEPIPFFAENNDRVYRRLRRSVFAEMKWKQTKSGRISKECAQVDWNCKADPQDAEADNSDLQISSSRCLGNKSDRHIEFGRCSENIDDRKWTRALISLWSTKKHWPLSLDLELTSFVRRFFWSCESKPSKSVTKKRPKS
jgi:hypothetical protein